MIFDLPEFEGMTCFEIGHALQVDGMFSCNPNSSQRIGIRTGHPVWLRLRKLYGMPEKTRRTKKRSKLRILEDESDSSESSSSYDSTSDDDESKSESSSSSSSSSEDDDNVEEI